jgi:hypothetical protein
MTTQSKGHQQLNDSTISSSSSNSRPRTFPQKFDNIAKLRRQKSIEHHRQINDNERSSSHIE